MARTTLLVRCSKEEAQLIRDAAKREGRTLSSYVVNSANGYIRDKQQVLEAIPPNGEREDNPLRQTLPSNSRR